MSTQRGRGTSRGRGQRRQRQPTRPNESFRHHNGDAENQSKQGYLALQKAFYDISKKFQLSQEEKLILQKENENLKQTLEKSYKAFDDKYKENEKLKRELDAKQNSDKMDQSNLDESTGLDSTRQEMKEPPATQEVQKISSSTQTMEEKSDGAELTLSNCKRLLEDCGLKIVSQDDKYNLILINISSFKHWVNNSTGGKVQVDFRKRPLNERFDQTDEKFVVQNNDRKNYDQEAMIIMLKSKISDQANVIKAQRHLLTKMREIQPALTAEKEMQNKSNQYHIVKRYHETFLHYSQEAANQVKLLKIQLENQSEYTKRLLVVVMGSKDLPKQLWWLSELRREKKCQEEKQIDESSSFPVSEEHIEDDAEENLTNEDDYDNGANGGLYSIAVQETDESLSPAANESSASVVTLLESGSSSGNSKLGMQISRARGLIDPIKNNSFGMRTEIKPNICTDSNNDSHGVAEAESDDFVVLNEEPAASGGVPSIAVGAKQCPVCYISFTPTYDQQAFESHVLAHFRD